MSSEIKLRAWDENLKKMITNENMLSRRFISLNGKTYKIRENLDYSENIIETDIILMQGIGLKDKNNEEWYHEDIGEFDNGDRFVIKSEEWVEYFVDWIGEPKCEDQARDLYRISNAKKIGNSFENPELLEAK